MKHSIIKSYNTILLVIVFFVGVLIYSNWFPDNGSVGSVFILVPIIFFICKFILELLLIDPDKDSKSNQNKKTNNAQNFVDENKGEKIDKKTNDWDDIV